MTGGDDDMIGCLVEIRDNALAAVPPRWPALRETLAAALPDPLPPHTAIPLAMTRAAGGLLRDGVPFGVAWSIINAAVRIIDDLGDDDSRHALHRRVGVGRAVNYASALLQLATLVLNALPAAMGRQDLVEEFAVASLQLATGQDRDLGGEIVDVAAYVQLVEDKTCAGYQFAGFGGARVVGAPPAVLAACRAAGYHIGMVLQLLDDLESMWLPDGDLVHGRRTFPIWHGLAHVDHPASIELRALVFGPSPHEHAERIRGVLHRLDAPRSVLAAALEERRLALAALARCREPAGHDLLASYFDFIFRDTAALIAPPGGATARLPGDGR
jgi:geranylgeranyl pyrophosphate synthase